MAKKLIYISGPISGITEERARETFRAAELWIRENMKGYVPVNPFRLMIPGADYERQMEIDLAVVKKCDAMFMLYGWEQSGGACREHRKAAQYEKSLFYQEEIWEEEKEKK